MKKSLVTLIAFVAFAGLLAWVLTSDRGRVREKEEVFRGDIAKEADLTRVEVAKYDNSAQMPDPKTPGKTIFGRKQASDLVMDKQGDDWMASRPFQGAVDPDAAKAIVKAVVELKPDVRKDEKLDPKTLGLQQPGMEVSLTLKDGKQIKISLGDNTPVGGKIFASISGKDGLFLVPTSFRTDLDKDPASIRDKKLARFKKEDVMRVTYVNAKGTVVVEQTKKTDKETFWNITSPAAYKADEFAITSSISKISDTDAKDFAPNPNDLRAYGLDRPRAQCRVELKDGKYYDIAVGNQTRQKVKTSDYASATETKDLVYAMRQGRPEVLLMESSLFDDLSKDVMALRDKKVLAVKRDAVTQVKVERQAGLSFAVTRNGVDWAIQTPQTGKASKTKIDDILYDLTDLEAKDYLPEGTDLKATGLAVPATTITLKVRVGKDLVIKIGDQVKVGAETQYYCQTSDSGQVYKVGELVVKDLPAKVEDLKESAGGGMPPMGNSIPMPPR